MDLKDKHHAPPGERIRELLAKKGWTQDELAQILERPRPTIVNIINGKIAITPETAVSLAQVFGTDAAYWLSLEADYRLFQTKPADEAGIAKRVRLFESGPLKEMERRGWIRGSKNADELEQQLCNFFGVENLDNEPQITVATLRSIQTEPLTPAQRAWCFRAKQLAKVVHAEKFKPELLAQCEKRLQELKAFPDLASEVPTVLAGFGIRFVVVEPLSGSRMDGAAFWLSPTTPVIALSMRFDRIGAFWFALAHEFAHIKNGDASFDTELVGESALPSEAKPDIERLADEYAEQMLVPPDKLSSFILRVSPLYSKTRINQFANRLKVHPGIIIHQLHRRGEIDWSANREMLAKVKDKVIGVALTDGWGKSVSVEL